MSLRRFTATPLFDAHKAFTRAASGFAMLEDYPDTRAFITSIKDRGINADADYLQAQAFLKSYSRKSEGTYTSFRNEVERFLIWSWLIEEKSIDQLRRSDIERFFDFLNKPPKPWISKGIYARFIISEGLYRQNPQWRPFSVRATKADTLKAKEQGVDAPLDLSMHSLSQSAWSLSYSTLSIFFDYMAQEDYVLGNPIKGIRKNSPFIIKQSSQSAESHRLSDLQWEYVLESTTELAGDDSLHERTLFVVACMKSLYLRISELSDRDSWKPAWEHFYKDSDGNWWLTVLGKGKKQRDISVPPALLHYVKRYRLYCNLDPLPVSGDKHPIVKSQRRAVGLTSRQLRRVVQDAFDNAYHKMVDDGRQEDAKTLRSATSHYLRHTGASHDIQTRPIKHMSDDLGHATMGTTDKIYINSDRKARAHSGRKRKV